MPVLPHRTGQLRFEDSGGPGLPVILAHGFLMDLEMFRPQVLNLPHYRWITWDTRHHGGSVQTTDGPYSYWDQARDALALLEYLGIEKAVFGGHSQGGFIALRMALLSPATCAGLLLVSTTGTAYTDREKVGYKEVFGQWLTSPSSREVLAKTLATSMIGGERSDQLPWIEKWRAQDWIGFEFAAQCLIDHDSVDELLAEISVPSLVLRGAADQAFNDETVSRLADKLGGRLETIDYAAHAVTMTHPYLVNPLIDQWLSSEVVGITA